MSPAAKAREALIGDGCMSVKEATKDTGFSSKVLYRAMQDGQIPYVQVGFRKVIPRKALRTFLADRLVLK